MFFVARKFSRSTNTQQKLKMPAENYNRQHERFLEDISQYVNESTDWTEKGEYRGIKWLMRRPHHTNLCGYVLYDGPVDEEKLDEIAHGGLTAKLGFDCAHVTDYVPFSRFDQSRGIYRNRHYVLEILKKMIDCILDDPYESESESEECV